MTDFKGVATTIWNPKVLKMFIAIAVNSASALSKAGHCMREKSGFCRNVSRYVEKDDKIILEPTIHDNIALYGYPGRKSGLEVDEIANILGSSILTLRGKKKF